VHLWFKDHFGEPYEPLSFSAEALERFVAPAFAVGVRLLDDYQFRVYAPFGLDDLFAMRLRPNPARQSRAYARIAASIRERWPEIVVES
jgi:hypothetical protein